MKTNRLMQLLLVLMGAMIGAAILFPTALKAFLHQPQLYPHVLFLHIVSVTLFFANGVIGILWESRSLASGRAEVILHTYRTVSSLDAKFSAPLIIVSVTAGIMLSVIMGDIWQIGWLSISFILFIFSGVVWVVSDIPTQYKVKAMLNDLAPDAESLPPELIRVLKLRLWISLAGMVPLLVVFILMVYKPYIVPVARWFG